MDNHAVTIRPTRPVNRADRLFATEATFEVPCPADRFEYKKESGSSDTQHSYDTMKV